MNISEIGKKFDVIVIGAGPAGISASLYARRANLNVLVLYHGESQLEKAHLIENYYGFPEGLSGKELFENGIKQARNLNIGVYDAEVTNIQPASEKTYLVSAKFSEKGSEVQTLEIETSAIIIATGNKKLRPNIKGVEEYEGKGVSYCAVCDGFFYRKKKVFVIGDGQYALEEASHLANLASSVTILTNGKRAEKLSGISEKIQIETKPISEIFGEKIDENQEKVSGVLFEDKTSLPADGVFIALGEAGGADFAKKLGLSVNGDSISVNEKMQTNAPGIFACGNVTGGLLQVCKAVYEGGAAGLSCVEYIRSLGAK